MANTSPASGALGAGGETHRGTRYGPGRAGLAIWGRNGYEIPREHIKKQPDSHYLIIIFPSHLKSLSSRCFFQNHRPVSPGPCCRPLPGSSHMTALTAAEMGSAPDNQFLSLRRLEITAVPTPRPLRRDCLRDGPSLRQGPAIPQAQPQAPWWTEKGVLRPSGPRPGSCTTLGGGPGAPSSARGLTPGREQVEAVSSPVCKPSDNHHLDDVPPPPAIFPDPLPQLSALPVFPPPPSCLLAVYAESRLQPSVPADTLSPRPEATRARPLHFLGALPVLNVPLQQDVPALVLSRGLIAKPWSPIPSKHGLCPPKVWPGDVVGHRPATTKEGQRPGNEPNLTQGGGGFVLPTPSLGPYSWGSAPPPHILLLRPPSLVGSPLTSRRKAHHFLSWPKHLPGPSPGPLSLHPGSRHVSQGGAQLPPPQQPLASRTSPFPSLERIR